MSKKPNPSELSEKQFIENQKKIKEVSEAISKTLIEAGCALMPIVTIKGNQVFPSVEIVVIPKKSKIIT